MTGHTPSLMRAFINFLASWGIDDGIAGLLTLGCVLIWIHKSNET